MNRDKVVGITDLEPNGLLVIKHHEQFTVFGSVLRAE